MILAHELSSLIHYVIDVHHRASKDPAQAFRRFDGKTPYSIHPIWAAMTILHEGKLPEDVRERGGKVLLVHDVREDTNALLPEWMLSELEIKRVAELTFANDDEPYILIWERSDEAKLFHLYDCTSNLLNRGTAAPERTKRKKEHVAHLIDHLRPMYGDLYIMDFALAIVNRKSP